MSTVVGPIQEILATDIPLFVNRIIRGLKEKFGIDVNNYKGEVLVIDHVCWRTSSVSEYIHMRKELEECGAEMLVESMIGGRPISTFKLSQPVTVQPSGRLIHCLELPCPKEGKHYDSGLEHCEFVLPKDSPTQTFDTTKPLLDLKSHFSSVNFAHNEKTINGDLQLQLSDTTSCKFHCNSLEEVIRYEVENTMVHPIPQAYFSSHL